MARSFSTLNILLSNALFTRGYAAAAPQGVASSAAARIGSSMMKNKKEETSVRSTTEKVSWVPDPVTGYYRPENSSDEIDAADLRAMLLNQTRK